MKGVMRGSTTVSSSRGSRPATAPGGGSRSSSKVAWRGPAGRPGSMEGMRGGERRARCHGMQVVGAAATAAAAERHPLASGRLAAIRSVYVAASPCDAPLAEVMASSSVSPSLHSSSAANVKRRHVGRQARVPPATAARRQQRIAALTCSRGRAARGPAPAPAP